MKKIKLETCNADEIKDMGDCFCIYGIRLIKHKGDRLVDCYLHNVPHKGFFYSTRKYNIGDFGIEEVHSAICPLSWTIQHESEVRNLFLGNTELAAKIINN